MVSKSVQLVCILCKLVAMILLVVLVLPAVAEQVLGNEYEKTGQKNRVSSINLYLDKAGKVVLQAPQKVDSYDFHDGIALLEGECTSSCEREKSFMNRSGKSVPLEKFGAAQDFSEGLAGAGTGCKMGFIDTSGVFVIPRRFEMVLPFTEGLAPVMLNDKCGFIDKSGQLVIDAVFDNAACFSEGLAPVDVEGKIGFIDRAGNWRIKPKFDRVQGFSNGVALVKVYAEHPNGEKFIDTEGNVISVVTETAEFGVPPRDSFQTFTGMFAQNSERFGQKMLGDDYSFSEGLAPLCLNRKFGYIDKSGKFAIQPQFDRAYPFANSRGLIWDESKRKYGYIDKLGRIVIEPTFELAKSFSEGLAAVAVAKNKWGYIDTQGKFLISPKYWEANSFSEGLGHVLKKELCVCKTKKRK